MKITATQGLAGIFVFVVLALSILAKEDENEIEYEVTIVPESIENNIVEVESTEEEVEVEESSEDTDTFTEEVNHVVTEDNSIVHYNNSGELIVPFPDYENFSDAFSYARSTLGDSSSTGTMQVFVWQGKKYHTETLKQ